MKTALFTYPCHGVRIALRPHPIRDKARLLILNDSRLHHKTPHQHARIDQLPAILKAGDTLVINNVKVIKARLKGRTRHNNRPCDILLCHPLPQEQHTPDGIGHAWRAMVKPRKKIPPKTSIIIKDIPTATVEQHHEDGTSIVSFPCSWEQLRHALERFGVMPLPPYIEKKRTSDRRDEQDYQTIFSTQAHRAPQDQTHSAIASPTAGLHFTPRILYALKRHAISIAPLTLYVGAGTFQPIRHDHIEQHPMHGEYGLMPNTTARLINRTKQQGGRIIAVGTTSLRMLETCASRQGYITPWQGITKLFITPRYRFRCADYLLTNFHQPRTTLFMLVCAFSGYTTMHRLYRHAIRTGYRFYSYGDACLLPHMPRRPSPW
ncbi:MAG: tRNA preQ1(34) S-adenosylmethionine ribosyltransferase-isomerase QueA [Alphaproteobacteria bacterium GM7ARS4]|nr:tRNA preQ1(34) S-adenosylmethionine ribosyltransferase-isomerase QueA [Alphaproteobacteria bacterium GM7ARS4]